MYSVLQSAHENDEQALRVDQLISGAFRSPSMITSELLEEKQVYSFTDFPKTEPKESCGLTPSTEKIFIQTLQP